MEINGVAHVILSVRDLGVSARFYRPLLEQLGLRNIVDTPDYLYYVGGRTAVGLRPVAAEFAHEPFVQTRCGLHHVCFRARSREHVDQLAALLQQLGARVVHAPREEGWVRATTPCCSKIRMASGSRSTTCRARAFSTRRSSAETRSTQPRAELYAGSRRSAICRLDRSV
jgi:catechol 2,3-dioxygenase-like lactoylglutathione lyase family enzyme